MKAPLLAMTCYDVVPEVFLGTVSTVLALPTLAWPLPLEGLLLPEPALLPPFLGAFACCFLGLFLTSVQPSST